MQPEAIEPSQLPEDLQPVYRKLAAAIDAHDSLMIAYSGGVDSGLLVHVARQVLGDRALPVIGISASLGEREETAAVDFLEQRKIPYRRLETNEMEDERYRRNNPDRCYFCKAELFTGMHELAERLEFDTIAYGQNADDTGDHRPGATAAAQLQVVAPLAEAGLAKADVRALAKAFGLELWDKPAAPCLASRVPYFQEVTPEKLSQIERAEDVLKDHGFAVVRVRHFGDTAKIEAPLEDHPRLSGALWADIESRLREIGFANVELVADGFRSGRLNDVLDRRSSQS